MLHSSLEQFLPPAINATEYHRSRLVLPFHGRVHTLHPLNKMALGLGKDAEEKAALAQGNGDFGGNGYYNGFSPDVEKQEAPRYRKMSRIDRPVTASISGSIDGGRKSIDETGNGVSIGQQMEAEAGNAIQYRTCSWQKV